MTHIEFFLLSIAMVLAFITGLCDAIAPRRYPRLGLLLALFVLLCAVWQYNRNWPWTNDPHFFDLAWVWMILIASSYPVGLACEHLPLFHKQRTPAP